MKTGRQEVTAMSQEIGCGFSRGFGVPAIRGSRLSCLLALHTHTHPRVHRKLKGIGTEDGLRTLTKALTRTREGTNKHVVSYFHHWRRLPLLSLFRATLNEWEITSFCYDYN